MGFKNLQKQVHVHKIPGLLTVGYAEFLFRLFDWDSDTEWNEAKENCEAIGWRLAVLDSEAKVTEAQSKV